MAPRNDPYRFQVAAVDDTVAVVIDGEHAGVLTRSAGTLKLSAERLPAVRCAQSSCRLAHIVCYTPSRLRGMHSNVVLQVGRARMDLGCLMRNETITALRCLGKKGDLASLTLRRCEGTVDTDPCAGENRVVAALVGLFHDECINPSFGALRLRDVHGILSTRDEGRNPYAALPPCSTPRQLHSLLDSKKALCHMYKGKDDEIWVVLHSNSKRVHVPPEHGKLYASLLRTLMQELASEERCLADLYLVVSKHASFHPLLASNFTILKKFLIKYNTHFAWFQDGGTRMTKVMLQRFRNLKAECGTVPSKSVF